MPTEPLEPPVAIWELMPITRPWPSSSGPPELPGLIEASVWITLRIGKPLGAVDLALERRHDPRGHGAREAERVADRDGGVAHLDLRRVAERQRHELGVVGIDLQHGEVVGGVAARHLGVDELLVLAEADLHVVGALDDVGVGDDRAVLSTTKPEPVAVPPPRSSGEAERRLSRADAPGPDEDHAATLVLVDVRTRSRAIAVAVRHGHRLGGSGLVHDLARGVARVDHVGGDRAPRPARGRRGRRGGRRGSWSATSWSSCRRSRNQA